MLVKTRYNDMPVMPSRPLRSRVLGGRRSNHDGAVWANRRPHFAPERERFLGFHNVVPSREARTYHAMKRVIDIVVASTAILLLLPVMLIIATAIMIEDGAPIVYHQFRTGR